MDESPSSDLFPETGLSYNNSIAIDIESYHLLLNKIETSTGLNINSKNQKLPEQFNVLLDDCGKCVDQSFIIIVSLLEEPMPPIDKVCGYIQNVINILKILSNLIKNIIEAIAITCHVMNIFPTYTGNIISLVFSHCKDSELIYGSFISSVEMELKELFRTCHELQLTYLMTMEKHFVFDLSLKEEQDLLLETLNINLKIGKIVQSLDVKTMAEQWKANTALCEKYSAFILDKNIYNETTEILAAIVNDNLNTVIEAAEGDKIVVRCLKVASFTLKVLFKISYIFKGAVNNDYNHIIKLLIYIHICTCSYHEIILQKSTHFTNLMCGHLSSPSDTLVNQLVNDEKFLRELQSIDINDSKDPNLVGYVLLLTSVMKGLIQMGKDIIGIKNTLMEKLYFVLPKCHVWFNLGLKFNSVNNEKHYGLYENALFHAVAFVATMTSEEYKKMEKLLFENILGNDYYCAVFSANLWVSLCRMDNQNLRLNTLRHLIISYQALEAHPEFSMSPQQVNLSFIIEKMFETLKQPEKATIYKQFNIHDEKNMGVWFVLKIRNLPEKLQLNAMSGTPKLLGYYSSALDGNEPEDVNKLIKFINLISTSLYEESNQRMEAFLLKAWSKLCTKCSMMNIKTSKDLLGYYIYLESVIRLTRAYKDRFENQNVTKIIRTISNILQTGYTDFIPLAFEILCELLLVPNRQNCTNGEELLTRILECNENNQDHIFAILLSNKHIENFVIKILNKQQSLKEISNNFYIYKTRHEGTEFKSRLEMVSDYKFKHKCIIMKNENDDKTSNLNEIKRSKMYPTSNFNEKLDSFSEDEQAFKKMKTEMNVEDVIVALEEIADRLCQVKEDIHSDEYKNRVRSVCEMLKNIIS